MKAKKINIILFLLPALLLFFLIYAIPIVQVVITSFYNYTINKFEFVGIKNYIDLFNGDIRSQAFVKSLQNTFIWVVLQSVIHVALGVFVALILSHKPRGWKAVRTIYMLPNIVSAAALAIIYLNVFDPSKGLVNGIIQALGFKDFQVNWYFEKAFFTTTFTWMVFAGLVTILVLAEIMSISDEIYEAARVDGADGVKIDLYIKLPLLKGIIGTSVILAATSMLKEFELIYMTTNGGPGIDTVNLPLLVYKTALIDQNYGMANTYGVVTIVAGIIIISIITRLFKVGESDR